MEMRRESSRPLRVYMTLAQMRMAAEIMEAIVEDVEAYRAPEATAYVEVVTAEREDGDDVREEWQMQIERIKVIQERLQAVGSLRKIDRLRSEMCVAYVMFCH